MIRTTFLLAMVFGLVAQIEAKNKGAEKKTDEYLAEVATVAEYRAQAEAAVREYKRRVNASSSQYIACREAYAVAEEGVDNYLTEIVASITSGERSPQLISVADQTNRGAEEFFACVWNDKPESARLVPIAPLVQFAVVCLETFLGHGKKGIEGTAEILRSELAWKSWDRIR